MRRRSRRAGARVTALAAGTGALLALTGCDLVDNGENLVAGKQAFVERCGSCHVLERAGTTGVTGPNLDEAFRAARANGFGENTFEGIVHDQILYPNPEPQTDPQTGRRLAAMPADLVTGDLAEDVAAYVAAAAAVPGEDTGALAQVGAAEQSEEVAQAQDGEVTIPADPGGGLVYTFGAAEAEPGELVMRSPNESSVPHNIALEGDGLSEIGPVVQNGGVSEITVEVEAGEYTFFCSVPGHRQAGMEGPLRVE